MLKLTYSLYKLNINDIYDLNLTDDKLYIDLNIYKIC